VGFLVFGEVHHHQGAAVEQVGEGGGGLGLAHAAGAEQQEHPHGAVGIDQAGAGGAHAPADGVEGLGLAHDASAQQLGQAQQALSFVGEHAADGHAGPLGHDASDGAAVHVEGHHGGLALEEGEGLALGHQLGAQLFAVAATPLHALLNLANMLDFCPLSLPA
jgi:hypothetical protein